MGAKLNPVKYADLTDCQKETLAWLDAQTGAVADADVFLSCAGRWCDLPDLQRAGQAFEDKTGWYSTRNWFRLNYRFVLKIVGKVRRHFPQYEPEDVAHMLLLYLYQFARTMSPDGGAKMLTYFGRYGFTNVMVDLSCEAPLIRTPKWAMEKRRRGGFVAPVVLRFGEGGSREDAATGAPEPAAPEPDYEESHVQEVWERALSGCSRRQRRVLALLYRDGKTLTDAGAILGVTRERVRQLHDRAIRACRARFQFPLGGWPEKAGKGFSGKAEGVGA